MEKRRDSSILVLLYKGAEMHLLLAFQTFASMAFTMVVSYPSPDD